MAITITPKLQKLIDHLKSEVVEVTNISLQEVPAEWLKEDGYTQIVSNLKQLISLQPDSINYEEVRNSANT